MALFSADKCIQSLAILVKFEIKFPAANNSKVLLFPVIVFKKRSIKYQVEIENKRSKLMRFLPIL